MAFKSHIKKSFTLIEILVAIIIVSIVMASAVYLYNVIFTETEQEISVGGKSYKSVPDKRVNVQSIELVTALKRGIDAANAVYVLGGANSNPYSASASSAVKPLPMGYEAGAVSFAIENTSARRLSCAYDFARIAMTPAEASPKPEDFTVVTIEGRNKTGVILQVRYSETTIAGKVLSLYDTVLRDFRTNKTLAYRYFIPKAFDVWEVRVGASHNWLRADPVFYRNEERSCTVVLPDPARFAGTLGSQSQKAISRFVFELPVLR